MPSDQIDTKMLINIQNEKFAKKTVLVRIKSELEYKNLHLITIFNPYEPNQIDKINLIYFWVPLKQLLYKGPIAVKIIILN